MVQHKTYQLRAYCTRDGYRRLDEVLAECATLYNAALQEWRDAWKMQGVSVTLYDQHQGLTGVRQDDPEGWGSIDRRIARGVLRRLDEARKAFFRRVKAGEKPGYPRFKSRRRWQTIFVEAPTPNMLKLPGGAFPGPAREPEKNPSPHNGIPVIGLEGVSPCSTDAPIVSGVFGLAQMVSPCSTDAPVGHLRFRSLQRVSPCSTDAPGLQDLALRIEAVSPCSTDAPEASFTWNVGYEVSPCSTDAPRPPAPGASTPTVPPCATLAIKGLPTIRMKLRQELPPREDLKVITITRRGRRLYVNLTFAVEQRPLEPSDQAVGIDMGVSDRMTLSTGEAIPRREFDREAVARAQQRLSRCRKGSRAFRKRSRILGNLHGRIRVKNRNECHQATTAIVRRFGRIAVEDLKIPNMTASAAGTVEEPGTNVAAKSGLNREILAQTWGIIQQQLAYKSDWAGRELVAVDPRNTSRTCSSCGVVDARSRVRKDFRCTACGIHLDADVNAAINILNLSRRPSA